MLHPIKEKVSGTALTKTNGNTVIPVHFQATNAMVNFTVEIQSGNQDEESSEECAQKTARAFLLNK